jgi:hypothetical protein
MAEAPTSNETIAGGRRRTSPPFRADHVGKDKLVVLGLVTTKRGALEDEGAL